MKAIISKQSGEFVKELTYDLHNEVNGYTSSKTKGKTFSDDNDDAENFVGTVESVGYLSVPFAGTESGQDYFTIVLVDEVDGKLVIRA